ncbi:hypothetical protein HHL16_12235 [Pseudoflavitalea sp. G-6-1-2]|uniref:hypothetical protein n=1 Tax=Pseudoflavitalea sp. G-6-1-2 TaxID=2728841 RepID=UPI00146B72B7|nr:hypothetical protein [Pseudoflavitalea sp. G-6-1-2]NML21650.1 hypothetical protein [Pseudoflavitalea sp. G-6-1-2]
MSRLYQPLFELRILHEYYLTDSNGDTIFDQPTPDAQQLFLLNKLKQNRPSVNDDLQYNFPPAQLSQLAGCQLKLVPRYSGFSVMMAVTETTLPSGDTAYRPLVPLPEDLLINIQLTQKNNSLETITNTRINKVMPALFYFTNQESAVPKLFPFLTTQPPAAGSKDTYEQGELTLAGGNTWQAFFVDSAGTDQWQTLNAGNFVTENDRTLLPSIFTYSFFNAGNVSAANFELKDDGGSTLWTMQKPLPSSKEKVLIDLRSVAGVQPFKQYTLKVSGDNGFSATHNIIFADNKLIEQDTWGLISLKPSLSNNDFTLIDNQGLLRTRRLTAGGITPPPIFEIRFKSRFTFWRYRNNKQLKIKKNPILDPYLQYDSGKGILTSLSMRNSSYVQTEFKTLSGSKYIANPGSYEAIQIENGRIYTDIIVPRSDLFDV